ncbi:MAG: hypothetical protein GY906_06485 [bacterium]|nr:hypothetical protein [bacterium]
MHIRSIGGLLVALAITTMGCSAIVSSTTGRLADNLTGAILNQNDPETVRQGAPAYLLLIDGLIADDPQNASLLLAGASLYSSYASVFVEDPDRSGRLSQKARDYGWAGLCETNSATCDSWTQPYEEFEGVINSLQLDDVGALFTAGAAWGTWIQANKDDWTAVADKARVDAMMQRVVLLDESYQSGSAHLYLGTLSTLLPASLGGKPEQGREHFERAVELSQGHNLMAQVLLAREYARLVFDREFHDRLCREVLEADPVSPGLTLSNVIAQAEAARLLDDSEGYFGE